MCNSQWIAQPIISVKAQMLNGSDFRQEVMVGLPLLIKVQEEEEQWALTEPFWGAHGFKRKNKIRKNRRKACQIVQDPKYPAEEQEQSGQHRSLLRQWEEEKAMSNVLYSA